jgi:hypothetical protein
MAKRWLKIIHKKSQTTIAEGPVGWGITSFEGNYYIASKYLKTAGFKVNFLPGFCPYKFLYVWLDFEAPSGEIHKNLGWKYWLPNPLLPFIWFRVAVPSHHPELTIEESAAIA